ncbi:PREDICTED: dnaJ homolog subfamily B member 8-like, partial [Apaloderma vittatum]
ALKWHSEKNPSNKVEAEKKFKEVSEACMILFNSQKPSVYGMSLKEKRPHRERTYKFRDFEEIFRKILEGMDPVIQTFWDPFSDIINAGENPHSTSGRGKSSSLFSDFKKLFALRNSSSPSKRLTSSFTESTTETHTVRSASTTTEMINVKKIMWKITRKITENGQEIIKEDLRVVLIKHKH